MALDYEGVSAAYPQARSLYHGVIGFGSVIRPSLIV